MVHIFFGVIIGVLWVDETGRKFFPFHNHLSLKNGLSSLKAMNTYRSY